MYKILAVERNPFSIFLLCCKPFFVFSFFGVFHSSLFTFLFDRNRYWIDKRRFVGNSSRNKNGGNSETKAAETVAKPVGLCDGVSVSRVVQSRNVSLVVAPVDKVSTVQQCSNISPEIVHIGADTSVDRISKAKPSLNNDHRRSQARNCLLHNADHPSSVTTSIENVQDTGSREESIQHISSLL